MRLKSYVFWNLTAYGSLKADIYDELEEDIPPKHG
jgi:hypothetical protein